MLITVKKGHNIKLAGQPTGDIEKLERPDKVAVLPEHIPFIKPKLLTAWGEKVKIGSPLFTDKKNPDIVFCSPGGGRIQDIKYGERRVIKEIVIDLDDDEEREHFNAVSEAGIETLERDELIRLLLQGGLWQMIKSLPFRGIADHKATPPSIIVSLDSLDYFQPSPDLYLSGNESLFLFGLKLMEKLSETVHVSALKDSEMPSGIHNKVTHTINGNYPADDPGVLLYHIKKAPEENTAWFVNGQDLLQIASLVKNGLYPTEKLFAIAGTGAAEKRFVISRIGSPVSHLTGPVKSDIKHRHIAGGAFRGYTLPADSYLGFYESSVTVMPEGDEETFFGFVRPGFKRQSYSKTFLSFFNPSTIDMNCSTYGELRACINCGTCDKICPVDIYPQFTFKCLEADEIEEALAHGLLDCVECGLCTYVCPSKIEMNRKIQTAKADYYKERA